MTLEYLNICQYSRKEGPLKYIQELEQFRADTSSLPVLMAADALIRKKLYRLQSEQRDQFTTFSEALTEVINNHKYLWNDARTKAEELREGRRPGRSIQAGVTWEDSITKVGEEEAAEREDQSSAEGGKSSKVSEEGSLEEWGQSEQRQEDPRLRVEVYLGWIHQGLGSEALPLLQLFDGMLYGG